jgi:outer membrane receptor for ferrienterochelin and colicin
LIDYVKEPVPFSNRVTEEEAVLDYALYISNKQDLTDKWSLRYGIRASLHQNFGGHWVYRLNDEHIVADSFYVAKNRMYASYFSIEPRVSLNYRIFPHSSIKAAYSYTAQQSQLLMKTNGGGPMDVWYPSGINIRPQTASQYSLGFVQYLPGNRMEASVEGYYKDMRHIIDYKDGATFLDKSALFKADQTSYNFEEQLRTGRGYAYGVEVALKAGFRRVDGLASYTWARSKRKIDGINSGATYLSPFDKPHTLNLSLNYDTGKRLSLSANFRWQSGQVTTVPTYVMEMYGKVLAGYSDRNGYRLPSYQRLDLSMTVKGRKNPLRRWQGEWNFSVMNVYNHANLDYVKFVVPEEAPETIQAKGVSLFGILPSVTYRFKF